MSLKISLAIFLLLATLVALPQFLPKENIPTSAPRTPLPEAQILYRPEAGKRYVYGFQRKLEFQGMQIPEVNLRGEFYLDVITVDKQGFEAMASEWIRAYPKSLAVRVRVDAKGEEMAIFTGKIRDDDDAQHVNILKDLLAQWVFPLRRDTVGFYTAKLEPQSLRSWKKTKITYNRPQENVPEIFRSVHTLLWSSELNLPQEIQGSEHTKMGKTPLEVTSSYSLSFLRVEKSALTAAQLTQWKQPSSLELETTESAARVTPWPELRASLAAGVEKIGTSARLALFGALVKRLEKNPEILPELLALLTAEVKSAGASSELYKLIVGTLATVASPACQAALQTLFQDPELAFTGKGAILGALTTTQAKLDANTRNFLLTTMQAEQDIDLAHGAAFALGSSLQQAGAEAKPSIALVQAAWRKQTSLDQQLALLDVMGNSGRAEFLSQILSAMQEQDSAVRAKAVFSLRFVNTERSTLALAQALEDPLPSVRQAAVNALQFAEWQEAYRAPLQRCALEDSENQLRTACQTMLGRYAGK